VSGKKPKTPEHLAFLKANGHELGALTGTDYKALAAIAALWHLYAYTRSENALYAVHLTLREMQATTRHLARPLIAYAMDWSDQDKLWPLVAVDDEAMRGAS
jgi:hypothetical protein